MVRLYLQTYFEQFCKNQNTNEDRNPEESKFDFDSEFKTMKEDVKKMTLHFHLIWTTWSILMIEPQVNQLFNHDGQVIDDVEQIKSTIDEM